MDLHPTPFPGKRRPVASLASKNEKDQLKPAASLAQPKPKRTFGKKLSGNITVERPSQKPITAKPWKPSGVLKEPIKPPKKLLSALPCAGGTKSDSSKKAQHVTFREISPTIAVDGLLLSTPVYSTEPLVQETPYQTAEYCSKCRLDRLETSSYWLSQIKLAESSGHHFVSAAFFRLALDCKAQPFICLQNELKHYRNRHGVFFMGTLWDDLLRDYGFTNDQLDKSYGDCDSFDAVIVDKFHSKANVSDPGNCTTDRDICAGYDIIDKLEDFDANNDEPEEIFVVKHFEDELQVASSSMDSRLENFPDDGNMSSNSVVRSGKSVRTVRNKSKFIDLTINDSSADMRTNKAITSGKKAVQPGTRIGDIMSDRDKETGDKMGSNDLLKIKIKAEEKCASTHMVDETVNSVEVEDNLESEENAAFS